MVVVLLEQTCVFFLKDKDFNVFSLDNLSRKGSSFNLNNLKKLKIKNFKYDISNNKKITLLPKFDLIIGPAAQKQLWKFQKIILIK